MKVLVCGLGSIGLRHSLNLKSLGVQELIGIDPDAERRERFLTKVGGTAYLNIQAALINGADLAIIASPNRFHVEQAQACADAGSHLFIEKPLGISNKGIEELIQEIGRQGLFAHVGSNWKFHPAFIRMKELLDQGVIGKVAGAQVLAGQWLPDWHPWEDYRRGYSARTDLGGGIVLDMHELDYLTWLFGDVGELSGYVNQTGSLEIETEDVACACIRFKSGVLATLQVDYIQRAYQRRYHIYGDEGTITWDIRCNQLSVYRSADSEEVIENVSEDMNAMYVRQMQHVLEGVQGNVAPMTSVAHARHVLNLQLGLKNEL